MRLPLRFPLSRVTALLLALIFFDASGLSTTLAQTPTAPASASPTKVYFKDCGHYLTDNFLTYWRSHGRETELGCPVTEQLSADGISFQYFKKARIEYRAQEAGKPTEYQLGLLGVEVYNAMTPDEKANPAYAKIQPFTTSADRRYFGETGHSVSYGMKDYWTNYNGLIKFGLPISEEYPYFDGNKNYSAQDFERSRLLYNPDTGVVVAELGPLAAKANNISTQSLDRDPAIPEYSVNLWEHWVDVNLSQQYVNYMEGDVAVRGAYVTTGKPGHETPTGTFYILRRVANEHMTSGSIGADEFYDLYNVLYTQYFTNEGHALHYAWWRSYFGVTGSHGCVNMDYDTSYFGWNWVNIGSRVQIHY